MGVLHLCVCVCETHTHTTGAAGKSSAVTTTRDTSACLAAPLDGERSEEKIGLQIVPAVTSG